MTPRNSNEGQEEDLIVDAAVVSALRIESLHFVELQDVLTMSFPASVKDLLAEAGEEWRRQHAADDDTTSRSSSPVLSRNQQHRHRERTASAPRNFFTSLGATSNSPRRTSAATSETDKRKRTTSLPYWG